MKVNTIIIVGKVYEKQYLCPFCSVDFTTNAVRLQHVAICFNKSESCSIILLNML